MPFHHLPSFQKCCKRSVWIRVQGCCWSHSGLLKFFSSALHLLIAHPIFIHRNAHLLRLPAQPERKHSLHRKLNLLACPISGSSSQPAAYQSQLKTLSFNLGEEKLKHRILHTSINGQTFAVKGMKIPLCAAVAVCLDYLVSLYEDGLSYSTINTARSAISTLHTDCISEQIYRKDYIIHVHMILKLS